MEDEFGVVSAPLPAGKSPLKVPERNHLFVYTAGRALSFWPLINGNNATWLESDIKRLYDEQSGALTFKNTLVDIDHQIGPETKKIVIGNIIDEAYITGVGIDVLNKLDRRQLEAYDIGSDEFAGDGEYTRQSVEINCDRSKSKFIVMLKPNSPKLEDQRVFSAEEAAQLGIRRTSPADPQPYMYEGKYTVVEAGWPRGVRGIAMLGNPADRTAHVFDVAAAKEHSEPYGDVHYADPGFRGKKRYPLNDEEHVRAAASYWGQAKNRDEYTPEQRAHITKEIEAAKKRFNIGDEQSAATGEEPMTDAEKAALLSAHVDPLNTEIASLRTKITSAEEEKSALTERVSLKDEEIAALHAQIADKDVKIAEFEAKIEDEKASAIAKDRLAKLKEIAGFEVKPEEEAALIDELRAESDDKFDNRVLREEIAAMKRGDKKAGKKTGKDADEKSGMSEEEENAGLRALGEPEGEKKNPYIALLD